MGTSYNNLFVRYKHLIKTTIYIGNPLWRSALFFFIHLSSQQLNAYHSITKLMKRQYFTQIDQIMDWQPNGTEIDKTIIVVVLKVKKGCQKVLDFESIDCTKSFLNQDLIIRVRERSNNWVTGISVNNWVIRISVIPYDYQNVLNVKVFTFNDNFGLEVEKQTTYISSFTS